MAGKKITPADIEAMPAGSILWDAGVPGLCVRKQRSAVSYAFKYRTSDGRQRWFTIGRYPGLALDKARTKAKALTGDVAHGQDPSGAKIEARKAETIRQLCEMYLADMEAGRSVGRRGPKKPSTVESEKGKIAAHIIPLLGNLKVRAVRRPDVVNFMRDVVMGRTAKKSKTKPHGVRRVSGGDGAAIRTTALLSGILTYGVDRGFIESNPARGANKAQTNRRERRLSDAEYGLLGAALTASESAWVEAVERRKKEGRREPKTHVSEIWLPATAAAKFLTLTGWRRGEALGLRWADIDFTNSVAVLADTKSGKSVRALSKHAIALLKAMGGWNENLLFPSVGGGVMDGGAFNAYFARLLAVAGLSDAGITPHVMRHSFASVAGDLGFPEGVVAGLLGHARHSITSRYVHHAAPIMLNAADAVGKWIGDLMSGEAPDATIAVLRPSPALAG